MGGFARIPIIEQQVATPRGPGPVQRSESAPPPSGIVGGIADVAKGTEGISKILQVQAEHAQILKSELAEQTLKANFDAMIPKIKTDFPGEVWGNAFEKQSQDAIKAMSDDPQFKDVAAYIQARAPLLAKVKQAELVGQGAVKTADDQDKLLTQLGEPLAREAGNSFDPKTFADGPAAVGATNKYAGIVKDVWGNSPDMQAGKMAKFNQDVIKARGQYIALNGSPAQLGDYIKAMGNRIDPVETQTLMTASTENQRRGMQERDAMAAQARDAALTYQDKYIKDNGHLDMGRLDSDTAHHIIDPVDYQRYTGRDYERPTPPADLDAWRKRIAAISSSDEADQVHNDLAQAGAFKTLNGRLVPELQGEVAQQRKKMLTPAGQNKIAATDHIAAESAPTASIDDQIVSKLKPSAFAQVHARRKALFDAAILAHPDDPVAIMKDADNAIKAVPRPTKESVMGEMTGAKPAGLPPPTTAEEKRKAAQLGKKLGLIP
jgi:hypothetical protein